MKNAKKLSLVLVMMVSVFLSFTACSSEDEGEDVDDCYVNLMAEVEIYQQKINDFNANPTTANCNELKTAALNLIEAASECGYYEEFGATAEAWTDIDCSDLE